MLSNKKPNQNCDKNTNAYAQSNLIDNAGVNDKPAYADWFGFVRLRLIVNHALNSSYCNSKMHAM